MNFNQLSTNESDAIPDAIPDASLNTIVHNNPDICSICINPFTNTVNIQTTCNHKFHLKCINNHKKTQYGFKCPMCKNEKYYDIELGLNPELKEDIDVNDTICGFLQECLPSCKKLVLVIFPSLFFCGVGALIYNLVMILAEIIVVSTITYNSHAKIYISVSLILGSIYHLINYISSVNINQTLSDTRPKYGRKFIILLCGISSLIYLGIVFWGFNLKNNNKFNSTRALHWFIAILCTDIFRMLASFLKLVYFSGEWPEMFVHNGGGTYKYGLIAEPVMI